MIEKTGAAPCRKSGVGDTTSVALTMTFSALTAQADRPAAAARTSCRLIKPVALSSG